MNSFFIIILLAVCCSANYSPAQCVKVISATQEYQMGGREESRQEILKVELKDNKKLEPLYFLIDQKKVDFSKTIVDDKLVLTAILHSAQDNFPTTDNPYPMAKIPIWDKLILVLKKLKSNKLIKRKIKLTKPKENNIITTEALPQ